MASLWKKIILHLTVSFNVQYWFFLSRHFLYFHIYMLIHWQIQWIWNWMIYITESFLVSRITMVWNLTVTYVYKISSTFCFCLLSRKRKRIWKYGLRTTIEQYVIFFLFGWKLLILPQIYRVVKTATGKGYWKGFCFWNQELIEPVTMEVMMLETWVALYFQLAKYWWIIRDLFLLQRLKHNIKYLWTENYEFSSL